MIRYVSYSQSIDTKDIYILLHGYFCIDPHMCPVNMYFPEGRRPMGKYMFTGHI